MKSNRSPAPRPNTKTRHRRTEAELIAALQAKIEMLEHRKRMREVKQDPTLKLADKLVRQLKKAEGTFLESGRFDLSNAAKASAISISHALGTR
jgi:uncharacterized protein YqeY